MRALPLLLCAGGLSFFACTTLEEPSREVPSAPAEPPDEAGTIPARDGGSTPGADATADAADGDPGDPTSCAGGAIGRASDDPAGSTTQVLGNGFVELSRSGTDELIALETVLTVPPSPPASGTLFLWPGIQPLPNGASYAPIDNGVLQPVLTWGPTCAPNAPAAPYASWWVSAQYVNTIGHAAGYTGCQGGSGMAVKVGDRLQMGMTLSGTTWNQKVTNLRNGESVSFAIDLKGQAQSRGLFLIEEYAQQPVTDVEFTSTKLTFAGPASAVCQPRRRGANDYFAAPRISPDQKQCCLSRIVLRANGVAATSPNGP